MITKTTAHTRQKKSAVATPAHIVERQMEDRRILAQTKVEQVVVDALTSMLMQDHGMLRPPRQAAALLALTVELHKRNLPFPARERVAEHLNCSKFTIDAALSSRTDEGYLQQVVETETGHVANRSSIIRKRYYVPSKKVISIADRAKQHR